MLKSRLLFVGFIMERYNPSIELIKGEVHKSFLRKAYDYAWKNSIDPSTKTGALIVDTNLNEIISYGVNHFTPNVNPTEEQIKDKQWKKENIIHAEPSAIFAAAANGSKPTRGAVMYMPWVPCTPCANAIIDAGIKRLIGHREMIIKTPERWWASLDYALNLLEKSGVKTFMYSGKIGGVKSLVDDLEWSP